MCAVQWSSCNKVITERDETQAKGKKYIIQFYNGNAVMTTVMIVSVITIKSTPAICYAIYYLIIMVQLFSIFYFKIALF